MADLDAAQAQPAPTLFALPDELLSSILLFLDPESLGAVQLVSKRLHALAQEPLLWRFHCKSQYRYWDPTLRLAFQQPIESVDWKDAFSKRRHKDEFALQTLDEVIATRRNRYARIESIAELGLDVCDVLGPRHIASYPTDDILARSFWNDAAAGTIYRSKAIDEWVRLKNGEPVSLERALGAYDMFVWADFTGTGNAPDFDGLEKMLDDLAAEISSAVPDFKDLSIRRRTWKIVECLRILGFDGVPTNRYNHLKNSFIGLALQNPEHEALPLITVAIFCCVSQRLGVSAEPCAYPYHVYGMVYAPLGETLDGAPLPPDAEFADVMYVDPFRSVNEISRTDLEAQLRAMGVSAHSYSSYLGPADIREMVLRTARNIRRSIDDINRAAMLAQHDSIPNPRAETRPDFDSAFYAALWAWLILDQPAQTVAGRALGDDSEGLLHRRRVLVSHLVEQYQTYFPWDNFLIERHILPLFENLPESHELLQIVTVKYREDKTNIVPKRRTDIVRGRVPHQVGQVFRHKRYNYVGVIMGWDHKCEAGGEWMRAMNVDSLPDGGNQSFYNVLVEDRSIRYVAAENISIITEQPPSHLLRWAGQYMKAWDQEGGRFVSNIQELFPDD